MVICNKNEAHSLYRRPLYLLGILLCMFLLTKNAKPQTATFSQYFNNPVYYNPAYTGHELGLKARMNFRNQFGGLAESYDNLAFSADVSERNIPGSGGFGIHFLSDFDGIGLIQTTSARLSFSTRVQLSDNIVTQLGIGPTFVNRRIDWSDLVFSDQIDPYGIHSQSAFSNIQDNSKYYPDLGLGFIIQFRGESIRFSNIITTLGASVDHVLQPDISFSGHEHTMPMKIAISGDILFDKSAIRGNRFYVDRSQLRVNSGFLFERHYDINTLSVGINGYKNHIYTGVWGRLQQFDETVISDLILMVGVDIPINKSSTVKMMYSYDYQLSDMARSVGTTHEISAIYELKEFSLFGRTTDRPRREKDFRRFECPTF